MRYYAQYNDSGKLLTIGTGAGGTEITKEEYDTLLSEIKERASLVDKLYSGEITIDDVKSEWREEIQRRVNERIEAEKNAEPDPDPYQEGYDQAVFDMIESGVLQMSRFVESLKRLYSAGKITAEKIKDIFISGKIIQEEYDYIIKQ